MNRPSRVAVAAASVGLLAGPAWAKKTSTPSCPPARYAVAQAVVTGDAAGTTVITLGDGSIAVGGDCPTTAAKLKATKKGTSVTARWKAGQCRGTTGAVQLRGTIVDACGTLSATLTGKRGKKRFKTPFSARTSRCGDGVHDAGGEACDASAGVDACALPARCTATCTCAAPAPGPVTVRTTTTTSTPSRATTTTTTVRVPSSPLGAFVADLRSDTAWFTSVFFGFNVLDGLAGSSGSLSLRAGKPGPNGVAVAELAESTVLGFKFGGAGGFLCMAFDPIADAGEVHCRGGGSPVGAFLGVDSHGASANGAFVFERVGPPPRVGDAILFADARTVSCPLGRAGDPDVGCLAELVAAADCADPAKVDFTNAPPYTAILTTGTATAQIANPRAGSQGGGVPTEQSGAPFDCNRWKFAPQAGTLVIPTIGTDIVGFDGSGTTLLGDVTNAIVLRLGAARPGASPGGAFVD